MTLKIRNTNQQDAALIVELIKELADYEKLLHEVVATEDSIKKTLFGSNPKAFCVIAEWEGQPAGFALYFYNYSTFLGQNGIYLEDLYVRQHLRGKGIGKALLSWLAKKAVDENCGRLEWWVLDWNEPTLNFYRSLGAKAMDEWTVYRLTGAPLEKLANEL